MPPSAFYADASRSSVSILSMAVFLRLGRREPPSSSRTNTVLAPRSSTCTNSRPAIRPAITAASPPPTLAATYWSAATACPWATSRSAPQPKVLKVVKPPSTPSARKSRVRARKRPASSARTYTTPSRNEPIRLARSTGEVVPQEARPASSKARRQAPDPPPRNTISTRGIDAPLSALQHACHGRAGRCRAKTNGYRGNQAEQRLQLAPVAVQHHAFQGEGTEGGVAAQEAGGQQGGWEGHILVGSGQ